MFYSKDHKTSYLFDPFEFLREAKTQVAYTILDTSLPGGDPSRSIRRETCSLYLDQKGV